MTIGLIIMAFGIAISIKAGLGTSPISSMPYVVSEFTPLTVGNITIIMHILFILLQIIILRKRYKAVQLLQLPVAVAFGYITDFAVFILRNVSCYSYVQQWILCAIGILLVGIGVSFEVNAGVVTLAGEGLILAICQVFPIKFSDLKVIFDVTLVALSCVVSMCFIGKVVGVREGTVAAAIFVGITAKQMNRLIGKFQAVP